MGSRPELRVRQRLLAHGRVLRLFCAGPKRPTASNDLPTGGPALAKQWILQPTDAVWFHRVLVDASEEAPCSGWLSHVCGQRRPAAYQYSPGAGLAAVAISNPLWQNRLRFHSKLD